MITAILVDGPTSGATTNLARLKDVRRRQSTSTAMATGETGSASRIGSDPGDSAVYSFLYEV